MNGQVAGVDGCRAGWLLVVVGAEPADPVHVMLDSTFTEVRAHCERHRVESVGVDMPIGLPHDRPRAADAQARSHLGRRSSTLFATPGHATLGAVDYPQANAANRSALGQGLSKQAFHLLPKIREVRAVIGSSDQPRFSEVHPESSFTRMAGSPLRPKSTGYGVAQRMELVGHHVISSWPPVDELPDGDYKIDDLLDALAAAWTARRMARGSAKLLGDPDGRDPDGYHLTISI